MNDNAIRVIGYLIKSHVAWVFFENVIPNEVSEKSADIANEAIYNIIYDSL